MLAPLMKEWRSFITFSSTVFKIKLEVQEFNQMQNATRDILTFAHGFYVALFHDSVPIPVSWGLERQVYVTRVKRSLLKEAQASSQA